MNTEPPISWFVTGGCFSGGPATAAVMSLKKGSMAFSIRSLLVATFVIGLWIDLAPQFLAALVLASTPCLAAILRFKVTVTFFL